jgi:guanidinoacetate N-methyltransferase
MREERVMTVVALQLLQSFAIIFLILFALFYIRRIQKENEQLKYMEIDRRYVDFLKQAIAADLDEIPMGYDPSLLQHFISQGGSPKELLLYDVLFSSWETAYLLRGKDKKEGWDKWQKWIRTFFATNLRCQLAWDTAGRYFDQDFVHHVDTEIAGGLDHRVTKEFPDSVENWQDLPANIDEEGNLDIGGFQVMQPWEEPLMRALVEIVANEGADLLEVGFGLGISASMVQEHPVKSHTIIEPHPTVFANMETWAEDKPNVRMVRGGWEEAVTTMPDGSFDTILFDTYPLRRSQLHKNHFPFFAEASRLLRPQGIFTYYTDEATHVCPEHQMMLLRYFSEFSVQSVEVQVPEGCDYWEGSSMLVIAATKS